MDIKKAIKQLDIEEKAGLLSGSDFWSTRDCPEIGLDSVYLADGPHGMRVQNKKPNHLGMGTSHPSTCFPTAAATACGWDLSLCEELGRRIGEEAACLGVSVVLGPGLNIKRSPLCGRNFEYFSEDAYLSGKLAAAYVRGIQSTRVTACVKHFAVNSRELGRMYYDSVVDEKTLREVYLTGFEIAVKEGKAGAVMTAYNKLNGVYCNQNSELIDGILRGEWGFDGLVVSDWGGNRDRVEAVKAGSDLEMPKNDYSRAEIINAVKSGLLEESAVDECVERLYSLALSSGKIERKQADWEEHADFARKCAENSIVLLKNRGGALPLNSSERVALIGDFAENPRYQGAGSSLVNPTSLDNILGAIKGSKLNFIGYERGFRRFGGKSRRLTSRALKLASAADTVVLCLGLDEHSEVEGADRENIALPANQTELLCELASLGKKIIAVLSCGGAVDTGWDSLCDGVLHAYLCGQSGAGAIVKILTGEVNPSGRLAESYPYKLSDCPSCKDYLSDPYKMVCSEGVYVGYKYYLAKGIKVKYPFGYGLSYTRFTYSDFSVSEIGVRLKVRNAGEMRGATVVQVYVSPIGGELAASPLSLKGFKKIFLDAGEESECFIPFDEYSFRVWNEEKAEWQSGGEYEIAVGENCEEILYKTVLNADGVSTAYHKREMFTGSCVGVDEYISRNAERAIAGAISCGAERAQKSKGRKKRITVTLYTEAEDLKYSRGAVGKLFGFIAYCYGRSHSRLIANSMKYLPVRTLLQFMKFNAAQCEGFIMACNGSFFRGVKKMLFKK